MLKLIENISEKVESSKNFSLDAKPIFFHLKNEEDCKNFENLLKNNNSVTVYDNYNQQLAELKIIKKLQSHALDKATEIENNLSDIAYKEGVWVYYSWLNKVVHILEEQDFIEVRTNRNQHKITKNEQNVLREKKVGVIGLSVGQSIAMTLVLERCCGEIRLADFDDIELSNLNRIKTGLYNLGLKKIIQVAREIAELDPFIKVVCYEDGITENNINDFLTKDGKLDLLIEECDGLDIKILSRIKAKQYQIPVLMETNDRGMIDIERFDLDPDYPLLHNLIGDISWQDLGNLTTEQKLPMMMKLTAFKTISARQKLTVLELGQSISTWPQLASNVVMGAGVTVDVTRRILLNQLHSSGRFYVDIESIISDNQSFTSLYSPKKIIELSVEEMYRIADNIFLNNTFNNVDITKEIIERIILDAGMAPSSGNDQPWKFLFYKGSLFLFHDVSRSFSFGDYKNMASYISLGSAIENVVLSTHNHHFEVSVTLFPEKNNFTCIASFDFKNLADQTTEKHDYDYLYSYIYDRSTNRKVTLNEPASKEILQQLKQAAESIEYIKTSFITDKENLRSLGVIISAGDRIRIMHPHGHYDFFNREIRKSAEETAAKRTGMDIASLELSQQAALALELVGNETIIQVLRDIDGLKALKEVSVPNTINSAAMGFIETNSFTPIDFVNGGRAVQRQWLMSTKLGYAYHPMVVPLYLFYRLVFGNGEDLNEATISELKSLRKQFMKLFPGEEKRGEILLFRIFKAENVTIKSPRLNLNEILFT